MREIRISENEIKKWLSDPKGMYLSIPVKVGWEELQLTDKQVLANAIAMANGEEMPYVDKSIFNIIIERGK